MYKVKTIFDLAKIAMDKEKSRKYFWFRKLKRSKIYQKIRDYNQRK